MPSRQGWAVFDDVAQVPRDALFIEAAGHVIVGAEDVKIAPVHAVDEERNRLFGCPGRRWFFRCADHAGVDETGHQQMGGDLTALGRAQLMG